MFHDLVESMPSPHFNLLEVWSLGAPMPGVFRYRAKTVLILLTNISTTSFIPTYIHYMHTTSRAKALLYTVP